MISDDGPTDLSLARIAAASDQIDPIFLRTPQFVSEDLSAALVDEIVLVDDDDLRCAQRLIVESLGVLVEPAGAAGVAALARHGAQLPRGRTAVLLTGAGAPEAQP